MSRAHVATRASRAKAEMSRGRCVPTPLSLKRSGPLPRKDEGREGGETKELVLGQRFPWEPGERWKARRPLV